MTSDAHENYYYDVYSDERGHFAVFTPRRRYVEKYARVMNVVGMATETRGPFPTINDAARAIDAMATEWCYPVSADAECEGT